MLTRATLFVRLCTIVFTAAAVVVGCENRESLPSSPSVSTPGQPLLRAEAASGVVVPTARGERTIGMIDACDPDSFNAALGAGTCTRNGGITFEHFLAQLTRHGAVEAWRFAPRVGHLKVGQTLVALNRGGEVHAFTEVEDFGGGIVQSLNALAGVPVVAPECNQLQPADFISPGATFEEVEDEAGVEKYQCCIHPWMRAEVTIAGSNP